MDENASLALQSIPAQQVQVARAALAVWYATVSCRECPNSGCYWRHDCYDDPGKADELEMDTDFR